MFIETDELETGLYGHVIDEITDDNRDIARQAIMAAIEEVKSYLNGRYDLVAIFEATGTERNPMVVEWVTVIAVWNLIKISSVETLTDAWESRYQRVTDMLTQIAKGAISPGLPLLTDASGALIDTFRAGSNEKFVHYY
jgi:phage gp36-like protein